MRKLVLFVGIMALVVASVQPAAAQVTATQVVSVSATVSTTAKLTVGSPTVSFPNADPDNTPSIQASEGAIAITAKAKTGAAGNVTLTILAGSDLISGSDSIVISNVTWTAGGTGFVPGTMNSVSAQSVGSWTGSGNYSGTQTFFLANSWNYRVGNYGASATYTLTAP